MLINRQPESPKFEIENMMHWRKTGRQQTTLRNGTSTSRTTVGSHYSITVRSLNEICHNHNTASLHDLQSHWKLCFSVLPFKEVLNLSRQFSASHQIPPSGGINIHGICPCSFNCIQIPNYLAMAVWISLKNSPNWKGLLHCISWQSF